ncbi:hypothetical protein MPSEU_000978800 [Mayamaea pseudoterrestris]|nr:hypothetical protein MPSEU_000978800 [Mayamaea pseudoterrestris]
MSTMVTDPAVTTVRCYYEILGIPLDADVAAIKKAHRQQARLLHPDKNIDADTTDDFRLVQQAYECLSDSQERQWYDDHRTAILKGWTGSDNTSGDGDASNYLFDVTPFMMASCYSGYNDKDEKGFYRVYARVFCHLQKEEHDHYSSSSGAADNDQSFRSLPTDFGTSQSTWEEVSAFYAAWEGFSTSLNFAWADEYDTTQAHHRRMRRAMQDENQKKRRAARKARNDEVAALVRFVKRRDPRVQKRKQVVEQERLKKEHEQKLAQVERKHQAKLAREEWRASAEFEQAAAEQADLLAGRIRLADLDDDYDYGGGKKGKKKKNKGRKQQQVLTDSDEEPEQTEEAIGDEAVNQATEATEDPTDGSHEPIGADETVTSSVSQQQDAEIVDDELGDAEDSFESDDEESEPETWRCECCRKDFKSEGQLENHFQSKKHKAAFKKWRSNKILPVAV